RQFAHVIRSPGYVLKSPRPRATLIADAPVFKAPRRHARSGQRVTESGQMIQVVFRKPAPAVNHDHYGMRAVASGQAQVAELRRVAAVRDAMISRRFRELVNVPETHILSARGLQADQKKNRHEAGEKKCFHHFVFTGSTTCDGKRFDLKTRCVAAM